MEAEAQVDALAEAIVKEILDAQGYTLAVVEAKALRATLAEVTSKPLADALAETLADFGAKIQATYCSKWKPKH